MVDIWQLRFYIKLTVLLLNFCGTWSFYLMEIEFLLSFFEFPSKVQDVGTSNFVKFVVCKNFKYNFSCDNINLKNKNAEERFP